MSTNPIQTTVERLSDLSGSELLDAVRNKRNAKQQTRAAKRKKMFAQVTQLMDSQLLGRHKVVVEDDETGEMTETGHVTCFDPELQRCIRELKENGHSDTWIVSQVHGIFFTDPDRSEYESILAYYSANVVTDDIDVKDVIGEITGDHEGATGRSLLHDAMECWLIDAKECQESGKKRMFLGDLIREMLNERLQENGWSRYGSGSAGSENGIAVC